LGVEWITFAIVTLGIAGLGFGVMLVASRIKRERQTRHAERFGDHQSARPPIRPLSETRKKS
jgi:hypothetical protein